MQVFQLNGKEERVQQAWDMGNFFGVSYWFSQNCGVFPRWFIISQDGEVNEVYSSAQES